MKKLADLLEWGGIRRDIAFLALSGIALVISLFDLASLPFDAAWAAILLCGLPIILSAIHGLLTEFDVKADVLVAIALIASVLIGEHFAAGEVAFIMQLGALLEERTVAKARAGIEKLLRLTPLTARKLTGTQEETVPVEQVRVGDLLRVLPGETVPVDGVVLKGHTSINEAVMTGEALPVDKAAGDRVSSGTVNQFGSFDMEAARVGEDSSIQRMIRLVQSADAGKAKIVGIADRWATWIVVIALASAALTWLFTGEIIRAVTILVVFCPCALVLATPTAIVAGIGNATKHGFLVREGDALERLAAVKKIAFDKTGTLTSGMPRVAAVESLSGDFSKDEIYEYAACAESHSEHPLGQAVVRCHTEACRNALLTTEQFEMMPGRGIRALVKGREVLAGSPELLREHHVSVSQEGLALAQRYREEGCTIIFVAVDRTIGGFLALADTIRSDAAQTIERVKAAGILPVLLTGDHVSAAQQTARQLAISEVHANCLPEDKLHWIEASQESGGLVCMIGDGINDAPALKKAHVGIAMGGVGSDIAVDAADIALVNDDIKEIPHLLRLSKKTMATIHYNMIFSMALNFAAILLAMTGML
ncbi:MAG: cation-translocating P-type ATPase, partial [Candidatus Limiplasma sp.]|nr:cation-translocating P-type ATPase [Candidatus Limiplasma sp.]